MTPADVLLLLAGGGLFTAGGIVGTAIGAKLTGRAAVKPKCSCTHPLALHDLTTGKCLSKGEQRSLYVRGAWHGTEYMPCRCVRYDGPRPIETYLGERFTLPRVDE